jgi:hypothetical protein
MTLLNIANKLIIWCTCISIAARRLSFKVIYFTFAAPATCCGLGFVQGAKIAPAIWLIRHAAPFPLPVYIKSALCGLDCKKSNSCIHKAGVVSGNSANENGGNLHGTRKSSLLFY